MARARTTTACCADPAVLSPLCQLTVGPRAALLGPAAAAGQQGQDYSDLTSFHGYAHSFPASTRLMFTVCKLGVFGGRALHAGRLQNFIACAAYYSCKNVQPGYISFMVQVLM